jgi:hypothetical protein
MRLNVYAEEITSRIEVVEKTADTNKPFWGLRVYLKSPSDLHNTADDDDTSAVTFWFEAIADLNDFRQSLYTAAQNTRR